MYHGRYRDLLVVMLAMKVCHSKYYLSLFQKRALAPLQIPASLCEGHIYLLLCWVIILLLKSTTWGAPLSFACITISLYWVWLWLDLFYHELQCLVCPWSLKVLSIYVLRSQKASEIPSCYIILWLFWESVVIRDLLLLLASWLCHRYEWMWDLNAIVNMVSS